MKTSLPTSLLPALPAHAEATCNSLGCYVSDRPAEGVQRVNVVRRRAIPLDGRRRAAIRAYRENAVLA